MAVALVEGLAVLPEVGLGLAEVATGMTEALGLGAAETAEAGGVALGVGEGAAIASEPLLETAEVGTMATESTEVSDSSLLFSRVKPWHVGAGVAAADVGYHALSDKKGFEGAVKSTTHDFGRIIGGTASGVIEGATESIFDNPILLGFGALALLYLLKK